MINIKEDAQNDYINTINDAWTFHRLTDEEKQTCIDVLASERTKMALRGNYFQRMEVMNAVYYGFLCALGYAQNPTTWREENPESIPFSQP